MQIYGNGGDEEKEYREEKKDQINLKEILFFCDLVEKENEKDNEK